MSLLHVTDNRNHQLAAVLKDLPHSDAVHASDVATAYLVIGQSHLEDHCPLAGWDGPFCENRLRFTCFLIHFWAARPCKCPNLVASALRAVEFSPQRSPDCHFEQSAAAKNLIFAYMSELRRCSWP